MEMITFTTEQIEEKIAELDKLRDKFIEQATQELAAINGRKQVWLEMVPQPEEEVEKE